MGREPQAAWYIINIHAVGDGFRVLFPADEGQALAHFWIYRPDGTQTGLGGGGVADNRVLVAAHTETSGPLAIGGPSPPSDLRFGTGYQSSDSVEKFLVLLVGGHVSHWVLELRGSATVRASGPATWYDGGQTPSGATAAISVADAEVGAAHGVRLGFDVEHQLVGYFAYDIVDVVTTIAANRSAFIGEAALAGPTGTDPCACVVSQIVGPRARGPGGYELRLDGAWVHALGLPMAFFADVPVWS